MVEKPLPRYHLNPQSAAALLGPVASSLDELENRLRHYVERVTMPDADREAVAKALAIVASAHAQVLKVQRENRQEY